MSWGLDAVSVSYGWRTVLSSVTVPARPGQITVVVGGDGAGKTTALCALVGLVRPDQGLVRRPPKAQIGYVPATAGSYPDLSVRENLAFIATAYGVPPGEQGRLLDDMAERIGLAEATHRLGGHLSGGMQRKLAVGMALLHDPRLLVLDEPTTGVDPVSRSELWRLITRSAASGAAVVVATTYVGEAERGGETVLLDDGRVLASGSAADIVDAVPGALGSMPGATQPTSLSWRRGTAWRVWAPDHHLPDQAVPVAADIEDAVVIAELDARRRLR